MIDKLLREGGDKLAETPVANTGANAAAGNSPRPTREYFDSLQVEMRLIDAVEASTAFSLFGETFATPVMIATLSSLDKVYPDGMVETARAAAACGAVMWAGIGSEDELKAMIDTGARVVKIVKPYADHDMIFKKLEQAERHGAFATGMDISFFFGRKDGSAPLPMSPKTLDDMKAFVGATKLPFIVKGVLSGRDAAKALEAGAAGVVVSHHGGVVMDYALPPLKVLPRVKEVVDGRMPVFLDCGVTRGMDAFKAIALGASAVSVGRAVMAGLAARGGEGVRMVLDGITGELRRAMSMTGARDLAGVDADVIWS